MLTLFKQTPKRGSTCQTCMVVRMFVIAAILVAAFIIIADDRMHILASVTPMHAALAVIAIGMAGFVVKLLAWRRPNRRHQNCQFRSRTSRTARGLLGGKRPNVQPLKKFTEKK